ncbi:MAG: DUF465 domain-containing protein [Rhodobacterales bacterium]|nr:DUF465 domain-containing protein [Rhodobacterales bacterium]
MSNTPHDVYEDFPGQAEKIHALRASDTHFAHVLDEYHEVNRAVHRAETRVDVIDEEAETALRQRRMRLKDQIARALAA